MRDQYSAARAVERGGRDVEAIDVTAPDLLPEPAAHAAAPLPAPTYDAYPAHDELPPDAYAATVPDAPHADDADVPVAQPVSRRAALKVLGVLPLAGALGTADAQAPQHPRQPHTTPNQPAGTATRPANSQPKRKFLTAREVRTASVLADDILPRDERSGSATEAGVIDYIDHHMSVRETSDDARTQLRGGLRWMDVECRRRFGVAYDKAKTAQRHAILDDIAGPAVTAPNARIPATLRPGVAFFATFRNMVASGFFSSAVGWKDLQYQGNVFVPAWNGCPQPALDKLKVSYDVMNTRVKPA